MATTRETYRCMEKACGQMFTAPTQLQPHPSTIWEGRGVHCPRCYRIYVEWVNFYADWEYLEEVQEWRRKTLTNDALESKI